MWNTRAAPLAAVIFTALCFTVTVAKQLDAAPDAVVYQYDGCHDEAMRKFIHSGLLKEELNSSAEFQKAWNTGCKDRIPGGSAEHTAALMTYRNKKFRKIFNDAVAKMGTNGSTYKQDFPFKSLHFLLMDALRLRKTKGCKNVYMMLDEPYTAVIGSKIRFGRFMEVRTDIEQKEDILGGVYFNITTCFFYDLQNFCSQGEDLGLLSPSEMFTVDVVKDVNTADDTFREIVLKHSESQASTDYCLTFSRSPADVSTTWLILLLAALCLLTGNS